MARKTGKTGKAPSFAEIWDPDPAARREDIRKLGYANMASAALPALGAMRGMNRQRLIAAGAFAAASFTQRVVADQKSLTRFRAILREESRPAPADLQRMAESLFAKAGITDKKPVVRLISPQPKTLDLIVTGALGNSLAYTVALADRELHPKEDEALIMVGEKAFRLLSREEMAAVLAHETARAWVSRPRKDLKGRLADAAVESIAGGVRMSGMFNKRSLGSSLPNMAGEYGRNMSAGRIKRLDEERIARNAVGLFPHPTALKNAFAKTEGAMLAEMRAAPDSVFAKFQKLGKIMSESKGNDERAADIDKAYNEALDFYRAHKLPLDLQDILGSAPKEEFKPKRKPRGPE